MTKICPSNFLRRKNGAGFTLIELLVVIAIIGLLASVVMVALNSARDKARYAKAKSDMRTIATAMQTYKGDIGELPPRGDSCPACSNPPDSSWTLVIDALLNNDGAGWVGPYLGGRADKDPWGNYYGYDDNDVNSNCGDSWLYTAGSDKILGTSDDYLVMVAPQPPSGCY